MKKLIIFLFAIATAFNVQSQTYSLVGQLKIDTDSLKNAPPLPDGDYGHILVGDNGTTMTLQDAVILGSYIVDGQITQSKLAAGVGSNFNGVFESIDTANVNGVPSDVGDYVIIYQAGGYVFAEGHVVNAYNDPSTSGQVDITGSPAAMYSSTAIGISNTSNNDYFFVTLDNGLSCSQYRNISNSPVGPLGATFTIQPTYDSGFSGRLAVPQTGVSVGTFQIATFHDGEYKIEVLQDSIITNRKLAIDAVTSSNIVNGTIINEDIAVNAIFESNIFDESITANKIAEEAVGPNQLEDTGVTPGSYTSANVTVDLDGRITSIANGTAPPLSDGDYGDISVSASGTTWTVDDDAITQSKISTGAVSTNELGDLSITSTKFQTGVVVANAIATNAVESDKINAGAVTTLKLANDAVTGDKIASSTITADNIVNGTIDNSKIATGTIGSDKLGITGVTAGTYTSADITVNDKGQITSASNGAGNQTLSINEDTLFISGGNNVVIPENTAQISVTTSSGWADYTDTTYTTSNPFSVTVAGGKVNLPNNGVNGPKTELPSDIDTLYDGTVIRGRNGDSYVIDIEFKLRPTGAAAEPRVYTSIDIGGAVGEIYPREFNLTKGNGTEHYYLSSFLVYTLDTWEANGGTVKVQAFNEDLEIYDIRYVIARVHKAGNQFVQSNSMTADHYKAIINSNAANETNPFATENEAIQTLSISNDTLTISNGNEVVLPSGGGGGSSATFKHLASDLTFINGAVTQEMTDLSNFAVTSGNVYQFKFLATARSTLNNAIGLTFLFVEDGGADGTWSGYGSGQTTETQGNWETSRITSESTQNLGITTSAVQTTSSEHAFIMEATFVCTSSGNIDIHCGAETSNGGRVVLAGSSATMWSR